MERRDDRRHRRGLRRYLIEFNLFETDVTDEQEINSQRWSTRTYIVLLFSAMSILLVYNALAIKVQQIEVKNPSLETYVKLQNTYDTNLKCPCTQVSASYGEFVELIPVFHDICSSAFVSQEWIDLLVDDITYRRPILDFRATANNQFQVLRELCKFSQAIINNDIQAFYNDELISAYVLSESLLKADLVSITAAFQLNSITNSLHLLSFIRTFIQGNILLTAIETAYAIGLYSDDGLNWSITSGALAYNAHGTSETCHCAISATCNMWSAFYNASQLYTYPGLSWTPGSVNLQVENWFAACWPLESLLLSSIDSSFLNNQTALDVIATQFNWPSNSTPFALNIPKKTNQSSTFSDILETLFIESVSTELNYSLYYAQCQPRSCLYSINQHSSVIYMFTALLGLYGGLSVVLRLLIPYVVGFLIRYLNRTPPQRPYLEPVATTTTWKQRARTMAKLVRNLLVDLNLFKSSLRQEPSDIKQQRWTTRIYIALLILALIILTLYGMLSFETKLIQVKKPSFSMVQQLQSQTNLISSLQCPCTQLTVPYGQFIQLQPFYHQVCSSDFVSDNWINAFNDLKYALYAVHAYLYVDDTGFTQSQSLFVLLQTLCEFSNQTIFDALQTFERTQLASAQLLSRDDFSNQMLAAMLQFELETGNTFGHFLQLLRNITHVNQLLSGAQSNFEATITGLPNYQASFSIATYDTTSNNSTYTCSCVNDINCKTQWGLFNGYPIADNRVYSLPGFYFACNLFESLLQSTLECFYDNQDCMTIIINFYNVLTFGNISAFANFTRLNSSIDGSRFTINSTIESLVSQMFVEYWIQSTNYSSYFIECQPASCSYTISQRNSLLETITRIVGLIGGLSVSLRILVPFLVMACIRIIQRQLRQHQEIVTELNSPLPRFVRVYTKVRDWFKKVNVFEDTNRGVSIEQQCLATRIYIVLLIIALFILVLYTLLTYSLNTFTITNPSLEQYQQLQQRYGLDAVSCPCSRSSITQSTFIHMECGFHPVCTSYFISDAYLQELFELYNNLDTTYASSNAFTLQGTIFTHFETLSVLCNLAKGFVTDAEQQYLASSVISTYISDFDLFEKETNASLVSFQSTLPNSFLNSLQMIRGIIQGNGFVSAYSTNWYPVTYAVYLGGAVLFKPQYYGNNKCSCATSATCTQSSTPFIDGYLVGCTPLEAVLQSTIECLYKQSCIDLMGISLNVSLFNSSISLNKNETRFSSTATIESIVQQMFIETCSSNVSYNQFFEQCKPDSCSVTLFELGSLIVVVTTILGLYGGLTTFLQLVVPFIVFSTQKLVRKHKQKGQIGVQTIPVVPINNDTLSIDSTGQEEHLFNNPNLTPTSTFNSTATLGSTPMASAPLRTFFASIPRYVKILFGSTLFILVVAVIIIPSVYFTQQKQNETAVTVPLKSTSTTTSTSTSTTISKIITINTSTTTSMDTTTQMSITSNTTFSTVTVSTPAVERCTNLTFATPITYVIGYPSSTIAVRDINGDGILDLILPYYAGNSVGVLLGIGNGSFRSQIMSPVGFAPDSVTVGDFNGDGRLDLALGDSLYGNIGVLLGTGTGNFGPRTLHSTDVYPRCIVAKDINSDSRLDLVFVDVYFSYIGVFLGIGNGNFTSKLTNPTYTSPNCLVAHDFDGDGRLDVVVVTFYWPIMTMALGAGNGSFQLPTMLPNGSISWSMASGDFNGDSQLDVVYLNSASPPYGVNVRLGIGNGSFRSPNTFLTGTSVQARLIGVGDFNGDAQLDIVVTYLSQSYVGVFLGDGNGSFRVQIKFSAGTGSSLSGIAVGDFNNDGRLDFAVSDGSKQNSTKVFLNTCT